MFRGFQSFRFLRDAAGSELGVAILQGLRDRKQQLLRSHEKYLSSEGHRQQALPLSQVREALYCQGQYDQALQVRVRPGAALPVPLLRVPQQADVQRDVSRQDQASRSEGLLRGTSPRRIRGQIEENDGRAGRCYLT